MKIQCANCGYVHNSTVTPFLHDILRPDGPTVERTMSEDTTILANHKKASFKCGKCGLDNLVVTTWSVINPEETVTSTYYLFHVNLTIKSQCEKVESFDFSFVQTTSNTKIKIMPLVCPAETNAFPFKFARNK